MTNDGRGLTISIHIRDQSSNTTCERFFLAVTDLYAVEDVSDER
jgi:hypothetical protein